MECFFQRPHPCFRKRIYKGYLMKGSIWSPSLSLPSPYTYGRKIVGGKGGSQRESGAPLRRCHEHTGPWMTMTSITWVWPAPNNSGKYRFIRIPYQTCKTAGRECYWGPTPNLYSNKVLRFSSHTTCGSMCFRRPQKKHLPNKPGVPRYDLEDSGTLNLEDGPHLGYLVSWGGKPSHLLVGGFNPFAIMLVKLDPQVRVEIKNIWNHHLVYTVTRLTRSSGDLQTMDIIHLLNGMILQERDTCPP